MLESLAATLDDARVVALVPEVLVEALRELVVALTPVLVAALGIPKVREDAPDIA